LLGTNFVNVLRKTGEFFVTIVLEAHIMHK